MPSKPGNNYQLLVGGLLLGLLLVFLLLVPLLKGLNIEINIEKRLLSPVPGHPMGTDDLGRDLLSCLVYGTWISLFIGCVVVLLSVSIGTLLGLVAGLAGGFVDTLIMRIVDVILAFPGILLAIALVSFFQQSPVTLVFALVFSGWVAYARIVRGEVLKIKELDFITAARTYNASFGRILFRHLLPLCAPLVVVQASLGMAGVILAESSLNFLGIGLDPRLPTLGQLIDSGRGHIFAQPELIYLPGIVLFILIIAFNFLGEGLRRRISL